MNEAFNPVAAYRRGMEADIASWQAKIVEVQENEVFGTPYKEFAIAQLKDNIERMEDAIVGFDNLVYPRKF